MKVGKRKRKGDFRKMKKKEGKRRIGLDGRKIVENLERGKRIEDKKKKIGEVGIEK